jgi:hypothetical protein
MNIAHQDRGLRILARLKGGWLPIHTYNGAVEGGPFRLSADDLEAALKCLESDGLVVPRRFRYDASPSSGQRPRGGATG